MRGRITRWAWLAIGAALVLLPAFPVPRWVGAADQGPLWTPNLRAWGLGLLLILALAVGAARLATGIRVPRLPRLPLKPAWVVALFTVALVVLAGWVMRSIFASNPQFTDEMAQLLQARIFAAGRLAAPVPHPAEAFWIAETGITRAGWVSQYPPVHPLLLALGIVAHVPWLVNPLIGGLSVPLLYCVAKGLYDRRTALVTIFLWVASAWVMVMSGTYMNHVTATTGALVAWALAFGPRRPGRAHELAIGLALATVAATRPLDAVAAALPILAWVAMRKRWTALGWMTVGGAPVMLAWAYINWRMFGSPLLLGYTALYGARHDLGFHVDPWGRPYTPWVALSNMVSAIRRLHLYVYEWPIPALLPLGVWALFGRQRSRRDLIVAIGATAGPVLYFFYWHSGFYPGPRFYYIAAPFLVLGTARAWRWAQRLAHDARAPGMNPQAGLAVAAAAVLVSGAVGLLPLRLETYRVGLPTLKLHPERALARVGVRRALVLVPESWGSRTQVRLGALGVDPGLGERAYRRVDTCDLFRFVRAAERSGWRDEVAASRLRAIMDTAHTPPVVATWPDHTIRLRPGTRPAPACRAEMERDMAGFTVYGNLAWRDAIGLHSGIVFARDLFDRDSLLFAQYPGWPLWRYAPPAGRPDATPALTRLGVVGQSP